MQKLDEFLVKLGYYEVSAKANFKRETGWGENSNFNKFNKEVGEMIFTQESLKDFESLIKFYDLHIVKEKIALFEKKIR